MNEEDKKQLLGLLDALLNLGQGIRIREVQAMADAKWSDHYKKASDQAWNAFSDSHRAATELIYKL